MAESALFTIFPLGMPLCTAMFLDPDTLDASKRDAVFMKIVGCGVVSIFVGFGAFFGKFGKDSPNDVFGNHIRKNI
jgi:hypothetical protein